MKNLVLLLFLCNCFLLTAQDTFSIVAVDPETGEVGSAGATCVPNIGSIGGVILLSGIIPGRGGVNAQAYICIDPHINLDNAIDRMNEGMNPEEIIEWLEENDACFSQNFDPTYRQYGIAALDENGIPSAAAYTGENADDWKGHRVGDYYSIQGNILLGPEIVDSMEARFLATEGSLAVRLMAAMQGANVPGADSRCLNDGTSSTSAFLRVFGPDDEVDAPYLELNVAEAPTGVEPIDSLQALFNEWALTDAPQINAHEYNFTISPNPANGFVQIISDYSASINVQIWAVDGSLIISQSIESENRKIHLPRKGTYIMSIFDQQKRILHTQKLINF